MKTLGFTSQEFAEIKIGQTLFAVAECPDGTFTAVPVELKSKLFTNLARVELLPHVPGCDREQFRDTYLPNEIYRTADEAFKAIEMKFRIQIEEAERQMKHARENAVVFKNLPEWLI